MRREKGWRSDERGGATLEYGMIAGLIALATVMGVTTFDVVFSRQAERIAAEPDDPRGDAAIAAGEADDIVTGSIRHARSCDDEIPVTAFWRNALGQC